MTPSVVQAAILAWLGVMAVVLPVAVALVVRVIANAKDITAAWNELRAHARKLPPGPPPDGLGSGGRVPPDVFALHTIGQTVHGPGGLGGQCMDLAMLYLGVHLVGNAVDQIGPGRVSGWTWVQNNPANYPPGGAIVVWHRNVAVHGIGPYGHIAVALAADPDHVLSLDQNWPDGSPVAVALHDYIGVAGWHAPPR